MDICPETRKIAEAAEYIQTISKCAPKTAIILGSGLSSLADNNSIKSKIPYANIPCFPVATVEGHEGNFLSVKIKNTIVFMMQGRFHLYEGYSAQEVTFPIRVLSYLGVKNLILTNSAGGLNPNMKAGDLMAITDHLSFFCPSPLRGKNLEMFGTRFPDQTQIYSPEYVEILSDLAEKSCITLHKGIYAYMPGPQYETPSEISALAGLGASAVGMSTVPEAIMASHCGMKVIGLSCISNLASGMSKKPLCHSDVMNTANSASEKSIRLLEQLFESGEL
jgi:purine-nucleoside phosphorylase